MVCLGAKAPTWIGGFGLSDCSQLANDAGGVTHRDGARRNVTHDHRARRHHAAPADPDAGEHDHVVAEPDAVLDDHGPRLGYARAVTEIVEIVVEDRDVGAEHAV